MRFTPRYLVHIVLIPFILNLALTIALATQVLQLDRAQWIRFIGVALAAFASASLLLALRLRRDAKSVERARDAETLSSALSATLRTTSTGSNLASIFGSVLFVALAHWLVMRDATALVAFAVIAFVTSVLSIAYTYVAAKRILISESRRLPDVRYTGGEIALGRKLAVIFIGTFMASTAALVQLVTARVSLQLEKIAINGSERYFHDVYDIAARMPGDMTEERLRMLDGYIDPQYSLYALLPDGRLLISQPREDERLTATELQYIRSLRDGDSSTFVAPHVLRFQHLGDGSILIIRIPWDHFRAVPQSVAFYALLVALATSLIFAASTFFLARDVTGPLRRMSVIASELAEGNFAGHTGIFTDDEISAVAGSLATTRQNLRQLMKEVEGNGTAIAHRVRVMSRGSETLVESARQQSQLTIASSEALNGIRGGAESALRGTRAVADRAAAATVRAAGLAGSASEIAKRMDALFVSVEEISASAESIGSTAEQMTRRTSSLAGASDEVVSFVSEMDATIAELHRTAAATADLSRQVDTNAASGAQAVTTTLEGIEVARRTTVDAAAVMRQLAESSQQIAQMLTVIEDVAKRTNLLSLNAAIIAAQAGSSGSGFQVVAEEIRQLSDETRTSAKEIAAVVRAIQTNARGASDAIEEGVARVEESVALARAASASLQTIQESATASLTMSQRTTSSLNEQTASTRHLHDVITQLAQHVQEIHGATSEYARGALSLSGETERVRGIAFAVKTSTGEQSSSASEITDGLTAVAADIRAVRDHLEAQLRETERIASASGELLDIARRNDSIAAGLGSEVEGLAGRGRDFERAVARFRL